MDPESLVLTDGAGTSVYIHACSLVSTDSHLMTVRVPSSLSQAIAISDSAKTSTKAADRFSFIHLFIFKWSQWIVRLWIWSATATEIVIWRR